jgi:hypothetical protein
LVLASGSIDDRGRAHIAGLKDLEQLDIHFQKRISDAGIEQLAAMAKLHK